MGGSSSKQGSSFRSNSNASNWNQHGGEAGYGQPYYAPSESPYYSSTQQPYPPQQSYPPASSSYGSQTNEPTKRLDRKFSRITDDFTSIDQQCLVFLLFVLASCLSWVFLLHVPPSCLNWCMMLRSQ